VLVALQVAAQTCAAHCKNYGAATRGWASGFVRVSVLISGARG